MIKPELTVAIHQPNFLPWIGYFSKIKSVDLFVFLDDVQFERGKTFTSRTRILIQGMEKWLTIPVTNKSAMVYIKDIEVNKEENWKHKHLTTLKLNYKNAPFFDLYFPIIEKAYSINSSYLIDYNVPLIQNLSSAMGISTAFQYSSTLSTSELQGIEKIMAILSRTKANTYLSGSGEGSRRYIIPNQFEQAGIQLLWQQYEVHPYSQFAAVEFIKNLSVIDLLFHTGKDAISYL